MDSSWSAIQKSHAHQQPGLAFVDLTEAYCHGRMSPNVEMLTLLKMDTVIGYHCEGLLGRCVTNLGNNLDNQFYQWASMKWRTCSFITVLVALLLLNHQSLWFLCLNYEGKPTVPFKLKGEVLMKNK